MMRWIALRRTLPLVGAIALALGCAGVAEAQSADSPSAKLGLLPRRMSAGQRRAWLLLGAADHGAALFDAGTTRQAMRHYRELDPLLRPFARSAALYPVMQIAPFGMDWLGRRMATSRHRWIRRLWWLPQSAAAAGHLWAGAHNLGLPAVAVAGASRR